MVKVDEEVLFVDDGDVLTSAGVAAGVDLCLHMIRRDHGASVANRAARMCVVPPWRDGGQAQFIERPVPEPTSASTTATRAWALEHLAEPLTLARLAEHARMSLRSFTRRFRDEVGDAPGAVAHGPTPGAGEAAAGDDGPSDRPRRPPRRARLRELPARPHAYGLRRLTGRLPPHVRRRHIAARGQRRTR